MKPLRSEVGQICCGPEHGWWVVGPVASHCQSYDVFCLRRLQNSEIERSMIIMIWLSLRSGFIIIFPIKLQFIIQGQFSGAIVALPWRRHGTVTAWSLSLLAVPRMDTEKFGFGHQKSPTNNWNSPINNGKTIGQYRKLWEIHCK